MNIRVISGNLTKDPALRTLNDGKRVANFTVAVSTGYGDRKVTEFVQVAAWNGNADFVMRFAKKGTKVMVSGPNYLKSYKNRDSVDVYYNEIAADDIEIHFDKRDNSDSGNSANGSSKPASSPTPPPPAEPEEEYDDNLPF
jgi:single-strand DNA-binding protein